MSTTFITNSPWRSITAAARGSTGRVAVAYFGKGAAKLLPLKSGSILVVDASERAVKSGQTCPADLLTLIKKGVKVFSIENLHAKTFAFKNVGFVGSTNASGTSAHTLLEAVLSTREMKTLGEIRDFVEGIAKEPVGQAHAERLARIYKPPKFGGAKKQRRSGKRVQPAHVPLQVLNLTDDEWTPAELKASDKGRPGAKKLLGRGLALDELTWYGKRSFTEGDQVLQVTTHSSGDVMISPPGRVISIVDVAGEPNQCVAFVEVPKMRRRNLKVVRSLAGLRAARRTVRNGPLAGDLARAFRDLFYG